MGPLGHQRIAQRFPVVTTPIRWKVPKRRGLNARSKPVPAEGAIVEVSVMGAAIVSPLKWRAVVGSKVEVEWADQHGFVIVRREVPYPGSTTLAMYGVEYADSNSALAHALFEQLVVQPAMAATAREAAAEREAMAAGEIVPGSDGPAVWSAPNAWSPRSDAR